MLPFLKPKSRQVGVIVHDRQPDGSQKLNEDETNGSDDSALESAAQDIIRSINAKDYKQLAQAIKAAVQIVDAMPHEEGPHTDQSEEE